MRNWEVIVPVLGVTCIVLAIVFGAAPGIIGIILCLAGAAYAVFNILDNGAFLDWFIGIIVLLSLMWAILAILGIVDFDGPAQLIL